MSITARVTFVIFVCSAIAACAPPPSGSRLSGNAGQSETAGLTAEAMERGRVLASTACAVCHAIGLLGESPLSEATPLRVIAQRQPLDRLEAGFAEGLVTAHPAMPAYVFRASEIDDLIAYLGSLKAPQ